MCGSVLVRKLGFKIGFNMFPNGYIPNKDGSPYIIIIKPYLLPPSILNNYTVIDGRQLHNQNDSDKCNI